MNEWKCCRTCLSGQNLMPIFLMPEHSEKYSNALSATIGLKIDINDSLPQEMCSTCINFVNESIKFRRKCEESHKLLRENKHNIIKEETCFKSEDNSISIDISDSFDEDFKDFDDNITLNTLQYNKTSAPLKENDTNKHKNSLKHPNLESVKNNTKLKRNGKLDGSKREKRVREKIECEYCNKILTSRLSLRNHYKIHTGFDVVCEHCGKKFITRRLLLMHCRAKHGYEKTDKCSFCDYRASNAEQVKIHERLHTGEKPFVCKECNTGFHRKSSYLQHIAIHLPEKTVQCDQCPARFKSVTLMRIHKNRHRPSPYSFTCGVCDNTFVRRRNVVRHLMRVHGVEERKINRYGYEKTDKCSFCDYRASNAEQVKIHERLHTGEKPFVCKECNTGFHRKSSYLQHIAIHLPEKTVQCDQCPARFKSVTLMRIHKNRHRPSPYSFTCGVCDNTFVRRRNVVRHLMRVHGVEGESHVRRVRVT